MKLEGRKDYTIILYFTNIPALYVLVFKAAYGVLLFDETVGGIWLTGFLMILSGVWLLSTVNVTTIK